MARSTEFYKGRRKRRNMIFVPASIILLIIAAVVVTFYAMQKYAVITKDNVKVELPFLSDKKEEVKLDAMGKEIVTFEKVDANIVFEEPDYSSTEKIANESVRALRAIFVPSTDLTVEKLEEYAGRLSTGNALLLEMKPRDGQMMWYSNSWAARNYGLSSDNETTRNIQSYIDMLKERGVYIAAQISCLVDARFSVYSTTVAMRNGAGANYVDETGSWLDPYNEYVRDYVVEMAQELYDMGFDEVILADVWHPTPKDENTTFVYTKEMSTPASPTGGICGFAISIAEKLKDRPGALSIYVYTPTSLVKTDPVTGQSVPLFLKLYDRVFYPTDKYTYSFNLEDISHSITVDQAARRFVPVVENYLPGEPERISWVLIDVEED